MRRPRLVEGDMRWEGPVQKGMHVLVSTLYQRFWVHVAEIPNTTHVIGIICSRSAYKTYQFGDVVYFAKHNILDSFIQRDGLLSSQPSLTAEVDQIDANTHAYHLA